MTTYTAEVVDSLSLLSLKVASNVFDLSSGLHHVSIRDQIVRAQLAVRDLKKGDESLQSLLIVGAGAAGIAAALEAFDQGVREVVVVEAGSQPFGLLRGKKKRFVGPFMYEWPASFSRSQSYSDHDRTPWTGRSKSQLEWKAQDPISADSLAQQLDQYLRNRLAQIAATGKSPPAIWVDLDKGWIQDFVRRFAQRESARALGRLQRRSPLAPLRCAYANVLGWPAMAHGNIGFTPQYILLAAGMGAETVKLVKDDMSGQPYDGKNYWGAEFWGDDSLMDAGTQDLQLSIFGGGDGALQDVLRALTRRNHPLDLLSFLERDPKTKAAFARVEAGLLDAERQSRQFGSWTQKNGEYAMISETCERLARELALQHRVARRISQGIVFGKGKVSLFVLGKHFDKAYLLNRFIVHLIWACKKAHPAMWAGRMDFELHFERSAVGYAPASNGQHLVTIKHWDAKHATSHLHTCHVIAVRYGITPGTVPGAQMIQVSQKPSKQRTTLSRVELPFVVDRA